MNLQISIKADFQVVTTPFKLFLNTQVMFVSLKLSSLAGSAITYTCLVGKDLA